MTAHARVRSPLKYGLMALAIATPGLAHGAGMEAPENGSYVLARGGTGVSLTGTAYSLQFNPAGLADVEGWDIRLEGRFVSADVSFQRESREYNGSISQPLNFDKVSNSAGLFVAPGLYAAYRPSKAFWNKFAFGLGVFGPAGIGKYAYPNPTDSRYTNDDELDPYRPVKAAPQRYSLISSSNTILFPSLGIAFSPTKRVSFGVTMQAAIASVSFVQAMAGTSASGTETPGTEGIATLAVKDSFTPAAVLGVNVKPTDRLVIGAMFRPQVAIDAKGTLKVQFSDVGAAKQRGEDVSVKLNLAPQARLGASYDFGRFSIAGEGVWEGWSVYKRLILDASKVEIQKSPSDPYKPVGVKNVEKNWKDAYSFRLGGTFKAIRPTPEKQLGLQVHLGGLYETNAIPAEYQAIDTVTGNRLGVSAGATVSYGAWAATLGAMMYPSLGALKIGEENQVKRSVTDPTDQDDPPIFINRGTYEAQVFIASIGLAYSPSFMK